MKASKSMKKDVVKLRRGGPSSRQSTGPTAPRTGYLPNPFGKSIPFTKGPTGGSQPRVPTTNPRDIFANENPSFFDPDAPKMSPAPETLPIGNRKGGHIKSKKRSYASGGSVFRRDADGIASKGKTRGQVVKMREGGSVGSFRRDADGIASKGKTKGKMVKMAYGGKC